MYHFLALHEIDPTYLVAWSCLFLTDAPADIVVIEEADWATEKRGFKGGSSGRWATQPEAGAVRFVFEKSLRFWFVHVLHEHYPEVLLLL